MVRAAAAALVAGGLCLLGASHAFVGQPLTGKGLRSKATSGLRAKKPQQWASEGEFAAEEEASSAPSSTSFDVASLLAGACLGLLVVFAAPGVASADVSDIVIPVDAGGKTTTLDKEQLVRGKRLFNQACAQCHVGGSTRTNQNVTLQFEELGNALPARNTVSSLIDYMKQPTTYDGLVDISETHPSIKAGDIWPTMRSMKESDLYDISAYILYQCQNIPEKWGGGKQYY
jgi:photosystem II cytochrome c550